MKFESKFLSLIELLTLLLLATFMLAHVASATEPPRASEQSAGGSAIRFTPPEEAWLQAHPEIRGGVVATWPPLNFVGPDGQPSGIGVDILSRLSERIGLKVRNTRGGSVPERFAPILRRQPTTPVQFFERRLSKI